MTVPPPPPHRHQEGGTQPDELQTVNLRTITNLRCRSLLGSASTATVRKNMICAGPDNLSAGGMDTCQVSTSHLSLMELAALCGIMWFMLHTTCLEWL